MTAPAQERVGEGGFNRAVDSRAPLVRALRAVGACTHNTRAFGFNPHSAEHSFNGLSESLGYLPTDLPVATVFSMLERHQGADGQAGLAYIPTKYPYEIATHVAGMTSMIARSPSDELFPEDRAEVIADLINGYGESQYDEWGTRMGKPAIRKGEAISIARRELKAQRDAAQLAGDQQTHGQYEQMIRALDSETGYHVRRVAPVVFAVSGMLALRKLLTRQK